MLKMTQRNEPVLAAYFEYYTNSDRLCARSAGIEREAELLVRRAHAAGTGECGLIFIRSKHLGEGLCRFTLEIADELKIGRNHMTEMSDWFMAPREDLLEISSSHAVVRKEGDIYTVEDAGSTNGTYLNGERLKSKMPCRLEPGDVLRFGAVEFRFDVIG